MDHDVSPVDVLAFAPHQDDVEISCGGTVASLIAQGYKVAVADLTDANMGTRGTAEQRKQEAAAAGDVLGIEWRVNLGFPDGFIERSRETDEVLVRLLRAARPELIMVPYPEDRHPDHAMTGRIVPEAAFRAGLKKYDTGQLHHRPLRIIYYMTHYDFKPSFITDISDMWETKLRSIEAYRSQFAVKGAPEDEEGTFISSEHFYKRIEARARYYGSLIAVEFGEPFFQREAVRIDDPMSQTAGSVELLARPRSFGDASARPGSRDSASAGSDDRE